MQLDLSKFGEFLEVKEKKPQEKVLSEEELFIEAISLFENIWINSNKIYELCGVNLIEYELYYHRILENMLLLKYGVWKTDVILWYVFGRTDEEGKIYPLLVQYIDTEREVYLTSVKELWDFLNEFQEEENEQ